MNLLAKSLGQLAMLAVALFFFSCEDPTSIGVNPSDKFDVRYIEIPLSSSVIKIDTLRTGNYAFSGDFNRLLVGQYEDTVFSTVEAKSFTEFFPLTVSEIQRHPVYNDTVMLELALDYYTYGSSAASEQTISIHRLLADIGGSWRKNSESKIEYDNNPLGTTTFTINPAVFADSLKKTGGSAPFIVQIPLLPEYGEEIYNELLKYKKGGTVKEDSTNFANFVASFRQVVKGLAIISADGDKIFRINPASSTLKIYYGNDAKLNQRYTLSFTSVSGFSQITSAGGEVAQVTTPYVDYLEDDPKRYIQSGVGIFTKVDLTNFNSFLDTVPSAIINEAQFIVGGVKSSQFTPPTALGFRVLENNREIFFDTTAHLNDIRSYNGFLKFDFLTSNQPVVVQPDKALYFVNDTGSASVLSYNSDKKSYSGYVTMMMQQLLSKGEARTKYDNILLYPLAPKASKSVNRVVFPADQIKLKIYYTTPKNINQ